MSKQTDKYFATMCDTVDIFIERKTGERKGYDVKVGSIEVAKKMVETILDSKALHPRSPKFAHAMDIWANMIQQEVIDAGKPEHTDWAFLQGSVYAGHAI